MPHATSPASRPATRPEKDKIGLVPCVAFAVGTMIGAGVFVLSGIAVQKAGPASVQPTAVSASR